MQLRLMSHFRELLASICRITLFLVSWLVYGIQFLACSLEPSQPPPELPVVITGPRATQNLSEALYVSLSKGRRPYH